jgi:hypothetical protein
MTLPETPLQIEIGASLFLTLQKAATRQVDAAIDALQAGDYDVALTLAGAAEGMIARTAPPHVRMAQATPQSVAAVQPKGVDFDIEHRARLAEARRSACDADFVC